jgi:hypothetical protein
MIWLASIDSARTSDVISKASLDRCSESFDYGVYFSVAEYDGVWDGFAEDDVKVFKLALSPEDRNTAFEELHPSDVLNGFGQSCYITLLR